MVVFRLSRQNTRGPASVDYSTQDGSAVGGRAGLAWPVDYLTTAGTASFAIGQDHVDVTVPLVASDVHESDETFSLHVDDPQAGRRADRVGHGTATATIVNQVVAPARSLPRPVTRTSM